jgi:hypothetical protein
MDIQGPSSNRRPHLLVGICASLPLSITWSLLLLTHAVSAEALTGIAVSIAVTGLLAALTVRSRLHCGN